MSQVAPAPTDEEALERLKADNALWAEKCAKIVNKQRKRVPLIFNQGQRVLDAALMDQHRAGLPQRAIALKARQVGVSTYTQARAIKQTTLWENQAALALAHDLETTRKLFAIGELMYKHLPDIPEIKPEKLSHRRGNFLHFDEEGEGGMNSSYQVDTAGEKQSGRGGTYTLIHGSEVAFWADIEAKMKALGEALPDEHGTLMLLESTANGANHFKKLWDDAVQGFNEYFAFFWPWWKQEEYTLPFANEAEEREFKRKLGEERYGGKEETALLDPGPIDTMTRQHIPLTLEQLHWRRKKIDSPAYGGKLDSFNQEHPSSPEIAFIMSGRQVFEPRLVQIVVNRTEATDPANPTEASPGPQVGQFRPASHKTVKLVNGEIQVPASSLWVPKSDLEFGDDAEWKLWTGKEFETPEITDGKPTGQFVIGNDVSGRVEEHDGDEPAYDAISVIGHQSKLQVATWHGRLDENLMARELLLAALYFNNPWVAIDVTGGYGNAVARKLFVEFRYPYVYKRKSHGTSQESTIDRLGFNIDRATKPLLDANLAEAIREGTDGIRDRATALELTTYIKTARGRTGPEKGKFSDRLMAHSIAEFVADIQPVKKSQTGRGFDPPVSY